MKVLMLSTDMKIFEPGSAAAKRMASYAAIADSLAIVIVGQGKAREVSIADSVRAIAPGGTNKVDALFRALKEARALAREASVVTSQDPFFLGLIGVSAASAATIPLQIQLHTDCFSPAYRSESPRRFLEWLIALYTVRRASCLRAVSERIARAVRAEVSVPVSVLPIRVEAPRPSGEKPAVFGERFALLSVSRLTKEKRVDILIRALALVPNAELTVLGDGPEKRRLEKLAASLGVSDRVHFEGWKDPAPYYMYARAYVQASRYEGYGMAVMEAALTGLPIIGTDAGLLGDVFKDAEDALIATSEPASFARQILRLIESPTLGARLGGSARKTAEALSVTEMEYHERYGKTLAACIGPTGGTSGH